LTVSDADVGATTTVATGIGVTVNVAAALVIVSLVAVMFVVPAATVVMVPFASIVATAVLLEAHVTVRPVSTTRRESFVVSVNVIVPPIWTLAVEGATITDATGAAVTVTVTLPVCVSLVAVMTAVPAATPVTTPLASTVAIEGDAEPHAITRPVTIVLPPSFVVAVSGVV
jgi:hypothetical protein